MRCAVVGHVEWIEFAVVDRLPGRGEIAHADESWCDAAGGGAVAAVQLTKLVGACDFFTALGDDEPGRLARTALEAKGVTVHAQWKDRPTRRGFVLLDDSGERTITVIGDRLRPRGTLEIDHDAVYLTAGDLSAVRSARAARTLVATPRAGDVLASADVAVDVLVGSGEDPGESLDTSGFACPPKVVVATAGPLGGWARPGGPFLAAPLPGPVVDTYGAGDSFAAALTFALGRGDSLEEALAVASRAGAAVLTGRGPYEVQISA